MALTINQDLSWRDVNDELVALNSVTGEYHVFNAVGRLIWLAVAQGKIEEEIIAEITNEFDVSVEEATIDMQNYFEDMTDRKLFKKS